MKAKATLGKSIVGPCHEGWGSFAGSVCLYHHNLYRAASRGENAAGGHVVCLAVRPFASTHLVVAGGFFSVPLSMTAVVEKVDETFRRVLGHTYPQPEQRMNPLEAVAPARKMLYGRGQSVLDGEKAIVCLRCASRNRASGVSQT